MNVYICKYILIIVLLLLIIIVIINKNTTKYNLQNINPELIEQYNDYFDCYLKLIDINHQFANTYMSFDNKHVSTGVCENATLHVSVVPCPTDNNGTSLTESCKQTALLTSSKGNPIKFPYFINPQNMVKFFGIKNT